MSKTRAERLIANTDGMDAVVIMNSTEPFLDSTYWYLTESDSGTYEGARAIVTSDGKLHTIVSILEEETARASKGEVHVYNTDKDRKEIIKDILSGCKTVGVNAPSISFAAAEWFKSFVGDVEIKDASEAIARTVAVKDQKEIELTRKACVISSTVANELPEMISEGASEKDVASEMHIRMLRLGGSGLAFDTIAAFGVHSSEPHYMPGNYRLKKGDTALFDFGSKYGKYCSDLTRTIFLGDPGNVMKRAYTVVKEAQIAGLEKIRAGAPAKDADLAARVIIDASEFKGRFIHSFGHGIGMDIHQNISLSPRSEQILKAGNIVSAEPGVYVPGVGGVRIEDTVLVTEDGYELLTDYDHEFTVV